MSATTQITGLTQKNSDLNQQLNSLASDYANLKQQLDWFKRQLFGAKSEKQLDIDTAMQRGLFESLAIEAPPTKPPETQTITYQCRKNHEGSINDSGLRFDEGVPMKTIIVADPQINSIPESMRDIIGEKVSYRLAQPGLICSIAQT